MAKLFRLVQLINLLCTRRSTTMKTIVETCGIPERTAYRYLKTLSEANIPVYFDKSIGAYRLDSFAKPLVDDFTREDLLFIAIAIKTMQMSLNPAYRETTNKLIQKIMVRNSHEVAPDLGFLSEVLSKNADQQDISPAVSASLINSAIREKRQLMVHLVSESDQKPWRKVKAPALRFNREWYLVDKDADHETTAALRLIERVKIL